MFLVLRGPYAASSGDQTVDSSGRRAGSKRWSRPAGAASLRAPRARASAPSRRGPPPAPLRGLSGQRALRRRGVWPAASRRVPARAARGRSGANEARARRRAGSGAASSRGDPPPAPPRPHPLRRRPPRRRAGRRGAIVAADDEVVYLSFVMSEQAVLEGYTGALRAHPQGRRTTRGLPLRALCGRQFAAGSGVTVGGGDPVRRGGGGPHLRPRALAGVEKTASVEASYRSLVQLHPLGLAHDGAVPVEPKGAQVAELGLFHARTDAGAVEVFHPNEEAGIRGTGEQPGQQGREQVPDVQRSRGTRREASFGPRGVCGTRRLPGCLSRCSQSFSMLSWGRWPFPRTSRYALELRVQAGPEIVLAYP
jgi:hypothetical protein